MPKDSKKAVGTSAVERRKRELVDAFHEALTALHGRRAHKTGELTRLADTPPWKGLV